MHHLNKLLPDDQFEKLTELLPTPRQKRFGRKRCQKEALISGILQVLILGIPWNRLYPCGCSASSCYRYFRELQRRGVFKLIFRTLSIEKTCIRQSAIDTDSTRSFHFRYGTAWDGRHKQLSTKISLLTDQQGLPADVLFGPGNVHDKSFVEEHFKNTSGRRIEILNLDKIYVSLDLRRTMRRHGTYVNMRTRERDYTRKRGPKFQLKEDQYRVRFLIEKAFAWLENFKRCKYRVEYLLSSFKAFVYLALIIILIRN
jgi:transposase